MAKWNTTIKGGKLTKRQMTDEERKLYGLPLVGKAKIEAEMTSINDDRMMKFSWEDEDVPS